MRLFDLQKLDVEDEGAVRRDARDTLAAVGQVCRDGQSAFTTNRHTSNADIPSLDNLTLSNSEAERGTLLVRFRKLARNPVRDVIEGTLTVENLAVLELANVAHTDAVTGLDSAAAAELSVVNGHALNDLDT